MSAALALALLAAPVGVPLAVPISVIQPSPREMREKRRRDVRLCRSAARHSADPGRLEAEPATLSRIAEHLWRGEGGCRKDPALAITVLRFAIGESALDVGDAPIVAQLAGYLKERADFRDWPEQNELRRILWVGGYFQSDLAPQWSETERRAFIARDDIWAYLSSPQPNGQFTEGVRLEALLDPLSPRYALHEGIAVIEKGFDRDRWMRGARLLLEGGDVAPDPARAEVLLVRAAPYNDEAKLLLAATLTKRLASPDPGVRVAAAKQFAPWSYPDEPGTKAIRAVLLPALRAGLAATDPGERLQAAHLLTQYALTDPGADHGALLRWADAALRRGDSDEKSAGWRSLASLSDAGIAGVDKIIAEEFARAGGLIDGGTLKTADLTRIVTNDDYPARALREEREGVVESEAIIMPDGRARMVIVTGSSEKALGDEVRKLVMRRLRAKNLLPVAGRYVRVKLPPIQFRIHPCPNQRPITPAVEGALLVEGFCIPRPDMDVPIS